MSADKTEPRDHRRTLVLVLSVALLSGYLFGKTLEDKSDIHLICEMMGRVGLFLGALWLAWPSLRRPAQWVPPGIAMACLMGLVILAAQPKLRVLILPAIGAAIVAGVIVKALRTTK